MLQARQAVRKLMCELEQQEGPLGRLEIGPKIAQGGFGVVHTGEGGLGGWWQGCAHRCVWGGVGFWVRGFAPRAGVL